MPKDHAAIVLGAAFFLATAAPGWATGTTERVSVATAGACANGAFGLSGSIGPAISADGRFVAFWSRATNLVPGDTNDTQDIFVRSR